MFCSRNRHDRSEKNELDQSKTNRGSIFKTFMEPRNQFQCSCLRRPGIDSKELIRKFQHRAGIFKQSMGTRNRVGIGLLYRPARARICKPFKELGIDSQPGGLERQPYLYQLARLHLVESIPQNRFLGSLNIYKYGLRLHWLEELVPWN